MTPRGTYSLYWIYSEPSIKDKGVGCRVGDPWSYRISYSGFPFGFNCGNLGVRTLKESWNLGLWINACQIYKHFSISHISEGKCFFLFFYFLKMAPCVWLWLIWQTESKSNNTIWHLKCWRFEYLTQGKVAVTAQCLRTQNLMKDFSLENFWI